MTKPRAQLTSRDLQALQTKKNLFDVTMQMMKTKGYDNITIRGICEKAGTSTGTFYNYFENKEQILSYYYELVGEAFVNQVEDKMEKIDPIEKIIVFYKWYAEYVAGFGVDFCSVFFSSKNKTLNTDKIQNFVMEITECYLKEAEEKGLLKFESRTLKRVNKDLCIIVKGAISDWCVYEGEYKLDEYIEYLLRACINGLLK